ncbi:MAG TPA: Crp/Fnr family transcriptional regulator [Luteibacter sp.]|uniref:Crp/Fnr family transcriptional regulator n=1 Tax=Luteibacter sp. TaxID=1886636 RepID=UPI002D01E5A6|nr:Crp/Fnr family transcriptional regulator [Luteibacter sp.]HVI54820.1 Crp/Fnr family transcriptional regulator [Luteibacter sp.]
MSTASAIASHANATRRPSICCNDSCRHAAACEATRGGDPALLEMRDLVERVGPFSEGDRLVQPDAPHRASFAVLSGLAKTVGEGRVIAFHLPGELFALDVPRTGTHSASVVAVGKTWFCRFPRTATDALCEHSEAVAVHLRTLRRRERAFTRRAADGNAAERVTSFLLELLDRRRRVEGSGSSFVPLPMSRDDIGSYLDMSAATVTRMLAKLRSQGSIAIRADGVDVLHEASLRG